MEDLKVPAHRAPQWPPRKHHKIQSHVHPAFSNGSTENYGPRRRQSLEVELLKVVHLSARSSRPSTLYVIDAVADADG